MLAFHAQYWILYITKKVWSYILALDQMSSQNGTIELLFSNIKGSEAQSNRMSFL